MPEIYSNRLAGKQVRILELLPGSGNEAIKTRLITCDLSDRPDFEAVSYVWGEQTVKCQISCEGADITITENLHDALLQIRLPRMSRQIWADAVCVNQQDLVERSQQVSLMQLIFNQASRVLVWLGRDCGEEVHLAVGAIDLIYECCISYAQAQNLNFAECMSFKHLESVRVVTNKSLDSAFDNETWLSISRFYARPWFERVWCAQEIILRRHGIILIDGCHVTWERVGVAAAFLTAQVSQPTQYSSGHRQCDSAYRCVSAAQLYFHQGKDTLLGNLETFCIRKATDPRDIVYGLLGLLDYRLVGRILEPNYSKNTVEVYIDVVMIAVNDGSGLRILSNVQHEDSYQNKDDLPSWVPYWPRQRSVSFLDRQTWYAGGQQAAEVSFPSRREMAVRGIVFEEIVSVSDIHPTSLDEYGSVHPFLDLMLALWSEVNTRINRVNLHDSVSRRCVEH